MKLTVFFVILLLFLYPLLTPGLPITHDGEALVARIAAYTQAFADGHFPPRWAGNLNYGYGAPVFIFFYPLLGYLGAALHWVGLSYIDAYKALAALAFVGSGLSFFLWLAQRGKPTAAFIGALFYALSPYHFLNLYVRGDIGELMALAIAPLVLWSIDRRAIIGGSVAYALLILSHHGVAFLLTPVFVGYAILQKRTVLSFILGLGLSAYFWLPALVERHFTASDRLFGASYRDHFLSLARLVWSPWGFGDRVNAPGGLAPQIGLVHGFVLILAIAICWKIRPVRGELLFWLGIIIVSTFFLLPQSAAVWDRVLLLRSMGFPWRFIGVAHVAVAAVIGLAMQHRSMKQLTVVVMLLLLLSSYPLSKISGSVIKPEGYWTAYPGSTSYHGETTTIWTAGDPGWYAKERVSTIEGKATVSAVERKTQRHVFRIDAQTAAKILDNTTYFPGWQVTVNGKKTPIEFQDPAHRGLITFAVPAGTSFVEVTFGESPIRLIADIITVASAAAILLLWIVA
ncbi:hypothetical protein HY086_03530 [Candidatus Gottesmanbacteria bacterium]|nr:hypothetical protein [Candidatus Gottesmanbacteria bacterium]